MKHWFTKYRDPQEKAEWISYLFMGAAIVVILIWLTLNLL